MRALLVVNPQATTTSLRERDILHRALGSDLKVDLAETAQRGHARQLGARAALEGYDALLVLGGDGTVNEAVNGLLEQRAHLRGGAGSDETGAADGQLPVLGVIPGGSANVFARALGVPTDRIEATAALLDAVRTGRRTTVSLGRVNDRYFTFAAGLGLDAEVVSLVEARRRGGAVASPRLYLRTAVRHYFTGASHDGRRMRLSLPVARGSSETEEVRAGFLIAANTAPWTYYGQRPVNPCPHARFDSGLDVLAVQRMSPLAMLRLVTQAMRREAGPRGRGVLQRHDLAGFTVESDQPMALQVDGDYAGEVGRAEFASADRALRVLA